MVNLRQFIAALESSGELVRVSAPVDAALEISQIAQRQMKLPCPQGGRGSPLSDPRHGHLGGKLGIDATRKIDGEENVRPFPQPLTMPAEIVQMVERRWREYGLS